MRLGCRIASSGIAYATRRAIAAILPVWTSLCGNKEMVVLTRWAVFVPTDVTFWALYDKGTGLNSEDIQFHFWPERGLLSVRFVMVDISYLLVNEASNIQRRLPLLAFLVVSVTVLSMADCSCFCSVSASKCWDEIGHNPIHSYPQFVVNNHSVVCRCRAVRFIRRH